MLNCKKIINKDLSFSKCMRT